MIVHARTVIAAAAGIRVIHPRTGIVVDRRSQLIERLLPLFRAGLGGRLGNGAQLRVFAAVDEIGGKIDDKIRWVVALLMALPGSQLN